MVGFDFVELIASPLGMMLAGQLGTLLIVVAGLMFMFGLRRLAARLIVVAVVVVGIPFFIAWNHNEIKWAFDNMPRWMLVPTFAICSGVFLCWILWGLIAVCFGPKIASTVTGDVLAWLIKGAILAALAPYRGLSAILRRFASN